jgi:hypothetical protein
MTAMSWVAVKARLGYHTPLSRRRRQVTAPIRPAYTAVVKQDGPWWIGWIKEVPGVNCQEATEPELIASLMDALRDARDMNRIG